MVKKLFILALIALTQLPPAVAQKALSYEEKYAIVKEVYDKVYMAMGIIDVKPDLMLDNKRETSVAYLKRNKDGSRTLGIEEKAFDICLNQFGDRSKDALAFLIGHELGHFRYNHQWGKDFASTFAMADIEDKVADAADKLSELKYFETQADHSGGISCFLAGYDIRGLGEPLLTKIYEAYKLPHETPKYPSLKDRITLTKQNDSIVNKLITVFETGNFCMMTGEYREAVKCFEFVLYKGFKSREVFNNLGGCALLQAMNLMGKDQVKYVYPVEIDVDARVTASNKGYSDETKSLLERAALYFTQAVQLDNEYATGYINLACVNSLGGNFEDGYYNASKAFTLLQKKYMDQSKHINAYIIKAILLDQQKKTKEAKELLEHALTLSTDYLAEVNLAIMQGKKAESFKYARKLVKEKIKHDGEMNVNTSIPAPETIDGISNFTQDLAGKEMDEISMNKSSCYVLTYAHSLIYNIEMSDGHEMFFQQTGSDYTSATAKGIALKDDMEKVLRAYGIPDIAYATRGETIIVYKALNLVFFLKPMETPGTTEQVKSWMVWKRY